MSENCATKVVAHLIKELPGWLIVRDDGYRVELKNIDEPTLMAIVEEHRDKVACWFLFFEGNSNIKNIGRIRSTKLISIRNNSSVSAYARSSQKTAVEKISRRFIRKVFGETEAAKSVIREGLKDVVIRLSNMEALALEMKKSGFNQSNVDYQYFYGNGIAVQLDFASKRSTISFRRSVNFSQLLRIGNVLKEEQDKFLDDGVVRDG